MNRSSNVLVVVTILEQELELKTKMILQSLSNFHNQLNEDVSFLLVIQTDKTTVDLGELEILKHEVIKIPISCLSKARNTGIDYAISNNYKFVIFHDASIVFSKSFAKFVRENMQSNEILSGKLIWNLDIQDSAGVLKGDKSTFNIMKNHYIGSYVLPTNYLKVKFLENVGPGKNTLLKSGEDIAFLANILKVNHANYSLHCDEAFIHHPPRPLENSKQMEYARGQGALYRYFFESRIFEFKIGLYLILFWTNALVSVLMMKKNSFAILRLRLAGFFSKDYMSFSYGK